MAYFDDRNNFNEDLVVENVKLKEKILIFLEEKGFVEDLERDCVGFHQKVPVSNFNPFFVNFSLKFCDLNDGKNFFFDNVEKRLENFKLQLI